MTELLQQVDGMEGQWTTHLEIINALYFYYRLHLYGSKKGKVLASLYYHTKGITALDFSSSSNADMDNIIACGSRDGRISLWNLYQHIH